MPYAHRKTNHFGEIFSDIRNQVPPAVRTRSDRRENHLWDIIEPCWNLDPSMRPSAESIYAALNSILQNRGADPKILALALTPNSFYPNPIIRELLEVVQRSGFYLNETLEPVLGSPEAEESVFSRMKSIDRPPEFEEGHGHSIYLLFLHRNVCLLCGMESSTTDYALGHVRFDIGHRPFVCNCNECSRRGM